MEKSGAARVGDEILAVDGKTIVSAPPEQARSTAACVR